MIEGFISLNGSHSRVSALEALIYLGVLKLDYQGLQNFCGST